MKLLCFDVSRIKEKHGVAMNMFVLTKQNLHNQQKLVF